MSMQGMGGGLIIRTNRDPPPTPTTSTLRSPVPYSLKQVSVWGCIIWPLTNVEGDATNCIYMYID